jgi:hypothetical protein
MLIYNPQSSFGASCYAVCVNGAVFSTTATDPETCQFLSSHSSYFCLTHLQLSVYFPITYPSFCPSITVLTLNPHPPTATVHTRQRIIPVCCEKFKVTSTRVLMFNPSSTVVVICTTSLTKKSLHVTHKINVCISNAFHSKQ